MRVILMLMTGEGGDMPISTGNSMSSTAALHEIFTKVKVNGFVSELKKAHGRARTKTPSGGVGTAVHKTRERCAILQGDLAREKQQHVKGVSSDPT